MRRRILIALACVIYPHVCAAAQPSTPSPVVIRQTPGTFILDNGLVRAEIGKTSGCLVSLKYDGREMLAASAANPPGVWSTPVPAKAVVDTILVDPAAIQGLWAEISIRGQSSLIVDVRYALSAGDRALYCSQILCHEPRSPSATVQRGGFELRLNPALVDTLQFADDRIYPLPPPADWNDSAALFSPQARRIRSGKFAGTLVDGWDNAALQMNTPVYGFCGAHDATGIWIINASCEYLTRGGNAIEPTGWLDAKDGTPTLMNWWADEPAGDRVFTLNRSDAWSHVLGPFVLYFNNGDWRDAKTRTAYESRQWPYLWPGPDVVLPADHRAAVSGQIDLREVRLASDLYPSAPPAPLPAQLGMPQYYSQPAPDAPTTRPAISSGLRRFTVGLTRDADWQSDLLNQQIWIHAPGNGKFTIPNVPPGTYVLHIYCDGQFGEATLNDVKVTAGKNLDLGLLTWSPPHYGSFVWELGYPNRSASEFRHGADPTRWLLWAAFKNDFPTGVNYTIGQNDPGKDWNCIQYPGSTFTIHFPVGFVPMTGTGYLRIAIAGASGAAKLRVTLNHNDLTRGFANQQASIQRPIGNMLIDDIARDQVSGYYCEKICAFDPATCLRLGDNVLQLHVTGPNITDGLAYDCLRMEIHPTSSQMPNQGTPAMIGPMGSLPDGVDFGQSYKGDPSGNYTGLTKMRKQ